MTECKKPTFCGNALSEDQIYAIYTVALLAARCKMNGNFFFEGGSFNTTCNGSITINFGDNHEFVILEGRTITFGPTCISFNSAEEFAAFCGIEKGSF